MDLLSDMELVRDTMHQTELWSIRAAVESQYHVWPVNWVWPGKEAQMPVEVISLSEAARRLGIPLCQMLQIVYDWAIRYVMVDGIPHVPDDALDEYRPQAL